MDVLFIMIQNLFATYPWLGPACMALYFVSEALGANDKIKENTVYQSFMTFVRGIFSKFYTKKEEPK